MEMQAHDEQVNMGCREEYDQKKFFWRQNVLVQDVSILYVHVSHLGSCEKIDSVQWVCSEDRVPTFLTSSKVMLMLLVRGPHLECTKT